MLMLDVEAVCSLTSSPNMLLANEGGCKINAMFICDVGCHPIVWVNICCFVDKERRSFKKCDVVFKNLLCKCGDDLGLNLCCLKGGAMSP